MLVSPPYYYYYYYRLNEDTMIQYIYDITPTSNSANASMWQDYIRQYITL